MFEVGFEGGEQQAFPEASRTAQENVLPLTYQGFDILGLVDICKPLPDDLGEGLYSDGVFQFFHGSFLI